MRPRLNYRINQTGLHLRTPNMNRNEIASIVVEF
jgi:hypothetical protein